jgi:nicotinamide mononucleotide transporter
VFQTAMKILFSLLCFLFFGHSYAKVYYINPQGHDMTGNGSINNPWQSLNKATSAVTTAGNIIHVMAGTYNEIARSNLAIGVSIEGEGITSIIQSSLTAEWVAIISLRSPEGTIGNQHISNLKFNGQNLHTFWAIYIAGRSNVSINNCTITDFKDKGVIFDGRDDNIAAPPVVYAKGNTFYNNIVTNCAAYENNWGRGCLNIGGQDGMLIYNNTITQNSRPNGHNGWPIKYSNDGYLKDVKIYNNVLTKIPYMGNYNGENGWDFAIEFWNILGGMELYGNTIQGAVDLVTVSKNDYPYGVWFHHNKIAQQSLNSFFESGLIFELSAEKIIVEDNIFDKVSGGVLFNAQENTVLSNILIRRNVFSDIGRNLGNGNNGSGININCGTLLGNNHHYVIDNFIIVNNRIVAANKNAPLYGIQITDAAFANSIKIQNNIIKDFRVACVIANPTFVIDSLLIEGNTLSGNGNYNNPFYIGGVPRNYTVKNNIKSKSSTSSAFNLREQILRPFYYDIKRTSILEFIALLAMLISIWFSYKENIYVYPMGLISIVIYIFLFFDQGLPVDAGINFYYAIMGIYGWVLWTKRDKKKHRIIRITSSTKKELLIQLAFFAVAFLLIFIASSYLKKYFAPTNISLASALSIATAFTAMWLMVNKKVENWYWWIISGLISIFLCFTKHFIFIGFYYCLLLAMAVLGLNQWKKKRIRRKKNVEI